MKLINLNLPIPSQPSRFEREKPNTTSELFVDGATLGVVTLANIDPDPSIGHMFSGFGCAGHLAMSGVYTVRGCKEAAAGHDAGSWGTSAGQTVGHLIQAGGFAALAAGQVSGGLVLIAGGAVAGLVSSAMRDSLGKDEFPFQP